MRRGAPALLAALACLVLFAPGAQAAFGIRSFEVSYTDAEGEAATAGSHPFAVDTGFGTEFDEGTLLPEGWIRDLTAHLPAGFAGDLTAYPRCTAAQFLAAFEGEAGTPDCPLETQVGAAGVSLKNGPVSWLSVPVFNLEPPPGVLLRLGFSIKTQKTYVDVRLNQSPPYNAIAATRDAPQIFPVFGAVVQLWGNPSDPAHAGFRRGCLREEPTTPPPPGDIADFRFETKAPGCQRPVSENPKPFLTMPTDCADPMLTAYEALSWNDLNEDGSADADSGSVLAPAPRHCEQLTLKPTIAAAPTSRAASSPSGLDFSLEVDDKGLTSVSGRSQSAIRKAVVTLPRGMTINPSQAEGLAVCSEEALERETLGSAPGEGCPEASKIGTVEDENPLVGQPLKGSIFIAEPHRNLAGDSLIAFYFVLKSPDLGILVKQPVRVEPDPRTGQLITITEGIPQLPLGHLRLHFREGGRSPLVTPPGCGRFEVQAQLYPWSGGPPAEVSSPFEVISGQNGSPCPPAGPAPFHPGFAAGTLQNEAGSYSPFHTRFTRADGEQDISRLSIALPPGLSARLAGVERCPEAQIAAAKAKSGRAELASPSCPLGSLIGHTTAGAGVGSQLTYVPGRLYMAGPYHGDPLSVLAITPAVAGPFDVGTVVVREALAVDPRSGQARIDGAASDPIPHILAGIPLLVRELQVSADRSEFTLNPTSCEGLQIGATAWGAGTALEPLAESPVSLSTPFHAANCAKLGFAPRLSLRLKGGTRRGAFPALRLLYRPSAGQANTQRLSLRFPHSEFIEQGHFRTICTRVQFAAGQGNGADCPAGSVYGHARVFTPLLDGPVEGPVFLRSSDHKLPDVVLALHGPPSLPLDFEVPARIDSVHGGLRATASAIPDLPVSRAIVDMLGGQKGLFVNSTGLCAARHLARLGLAAHNGRGATLRPPLRPSCP